MTFSTLELPVPPDSARYTYTPHEADAGDITVTAYGGALEEAFAAAAEAMFALLADLEHVRAERTIPVSFIESDDALALVRWLELLLDAAREHDMLFSEFHVQRERGHWWGCATGGRRRVPARRALRVRHSARSVKRGAAGWEASCVLHAVEPASIDRRVLADAMRMR